MRTFIGPHCIYEPDALAVGASTPWHSHRFAHNTFALAGDVLVELRKPDGVEQIYLRDGDHVRWALAPAGVEHRVTRLTEGARFVCVFSHYDPETGKPLPGESWNLEAYA